VTKAEKGTDDYLKGRREQHGGPGIEQREMIMSKITLLVHAGEVEECHVLFSTNLVTDPDQQASCQTLIGTLRHTVSRGKIPIKQQHE
jgi:hypothetical protein